LCNKSCRTKNLDEYKKTITPNNINNANDIENINNVNDVDNIENINNANDDDNIENINNANDVDANDVDANDDDDDVNDDDANDDANDDDANDDAIENIDNAIIQENKLKFECPKCHEQFKHYSKYLRHLNKRKPCDVNLENFHLIEGKFKCTECPKTFARNETLQKHLLTTCKGIKNKQEENNKIKILEEQNKQEENNKIKILEEQIKIMQEEFVKLKHNIINNITVNVNTKDP